MGFACLIWFFINLASNAETKDWPFIYDSYTAYILVIAAGSINLIASNLMTIINQKQNPALIGIFSYVNVGYAFGFDKLFF